MAESEIDTKSDTAQADKILDRLVFAALREQTRARRWRVGFMLFFVIYLTVVTVILFTGPGDGFVRGGKPDGEKHTVDFKGLTGFEILQH